MQKKGTKKGSPPIGQTSFFESLYYFLKGLYRSYFGLNRLLILRYAL
jgi:hypothetical protein